MQKITESMTERLMEKIWHSAVFKVKALLNINQSLSMNFIKVQADQFHFRCTGDGVLPRYELRYLTFYKANLEKFSIIVNNLESMLSLKSKFKKFNYKEHGTTRLITFKDIISEDLDDDKYQDYGNINYKTSTYEKLYKLSNYKSSNKKDDVYLFRKKVMVEILETSRCESFSITPIGAV